jgi:translation initiation factor IF-2
MSLQAEVLELKSNPKAPARATVIESSMQSGKGPVATVIVRQGTLRVGTPFICGPYWGKVKALVNDRGEHIKSVLPGMPAEVIGFADVRPRRSTMESMFANISANEKKSLKLVIRTDVQGSAEAITKCLNEIISDKITIDLLQVEPGSVSESDILLASASDAIVIGFNTKVENKALAVSKREGVQIKIFSIIYELIDQVKDSLLGLLDPLLRERVIGHARVKQVFRLTRGIVAGCGVTDGHMHRKACARVIRQGVPVYDGKMDTLRHYQDEVTEVRNGKDCGIRVAGYTEYEEGDIIECYELDKVAQTL